MGASGLTGIMGPLPGRAMALTGLYENRSRLSKATGSGEGQGLCSLFCRPGGSGVPEFHVIQCACGLFSRLPILLAGPDFIRS